MMNRREMIRQTGTALATIGLTDWHTAWASDSKPPKRRILFFSKSSGFEHSAIKRKDGQPSFAEQVLAELGPKHNFEFTFSKDGSIGGGGIGVGSKVKIFSENSANRDVLDALLALTDHAANFQFDVKAWKHWYAAQQKTQHIDARRDRD